VASDPIAAAIKAAVDEAFNERLPSIITAIRDALPKEPPDPKVDRFVPLNEVAAALGCNRSTVHRRIEAGIYPKLRHQGVAAGYFTSDLDEMVEKAKESAEKRAEEKKVEMPTKRSREGRG
jgi:predicted DNA-binding transcriptional regulator AlpA